MFRPDKPFVTIITALSRPWLSLLAPEDGVGCHHLGGDDGPVISQRSGKFANLLTRHFAARGRVQTGNDRRQVLAFSRWSLVNRQHQYR